jgi:hypothetical protein
MTVALPQRTRKENLAVPDALKADIQAATFGIRWGIALVALADYTASRWEAMAPGTYHIEPSRTDDGAWICAFRKARGEHLEVRLDRPLDYGHNHDNRDRRTSIGIPPDVRQRIERMIPAELIESGRARFGGVVLGMAKWGLDDLRRRNVQLRIEQAPKETPES